MTPRRRSETVSLFLTVFIIVSVVRSPLAGSLFFQGQPLEENRVAKVGGGNPKHDAVEVSVFGVDVLIPSLAMDCALEHAINGLSRFLQDLRNIYILLPESGKLPCQAKFERMEVHSKVTCISENSVFSRSSAALNVTNSNGWIADTSRRGWYYQQLLKLTFVLYPGVTLSNNFLIWDSDNILLAPYSPFIGKSHRFPLRQNESCGPTPAKLNGTKIGSYWPATRELLSKGKYSPAEVLENYNCDCVVHQMVIHKPVMLTLLRHLCENDNMHLTPLTCANTILSNIPSDADPKFGLSEYEIYFSWLSMTQRSLIQYDTTTKYQRTGQQGFHCRELQPRMKKASSTDVTYLVAEKVYY